MKKFGMFLLSGVICLSMMACNTASSEDNRESSSVYDDTTVEGSVDPSEDDTSKNETTEVNQSEENTSENQETSKEENSGNSEVTEESTEDKREDIFFKGGPYLRNLFEFKVNIGKIAYRIPIAYSAMTSRNWVYEGDDTVTLKPNQYTTEEFMDRDDVILYVSFFNLGINTQEIKDSLIGQITFDKLNLVECETEIRFPGNIIYGESTKEDIIKAYGEPHKIEREDGKQILTYQRDEYEWVKFTVDEETFILNNVDMRNFIEPDNFNGGTISEETPKEVSSYKAPKALGEDLALPYVQVGTELYSLPAPVSAFIENGWNIVEKDSHQAVVAKGIGNVTLEKDGIYISSDVINYTDNAVYIENCFVMTVYVDLEENDKALLSIPKGICVNMPSSELEKLLDGVEYKTSMDRKYTYYTIVHKGQEGNGFTIRVNKEISMVDSIVCQIVPSN